MPNLFKMRDISNALNEDFDSIITRMYIVQRMSSVEISTELFKITTIHISARSIQRRIKLLGITRSFSEAFNLAIKKGRKSYVHLRRTKKSISVRKGICSKIRYEIMQRDHFKCVLCGKTAADDRLEIDHIIPVVAGGTNNVSNLRVLCRECNSGKMLLKERKIIAI